MGNLGAYAKSTAALTRLPEDVLLQAYASQKTTPIAITDDVVREVQQAADRGTAYGIFSKTLDVENAVDSSFAAPQRQQNDKRRPARSARLS